MTVNYATANGTATAGQDYTGATGTVTFAAGETSKTINIAVTGDTTVEQDETFTVTLSAPSGATLGTATATGTITNDDGRGGAEGTIGNASKSEGNSGTSNLAFTVTWTRPRHRRSPSNTRPATEPQLPETITPPQPAPSPSRPAKPRRRSTS